MLQTILGVALSLVLLIVFTLLLTEVAGFSFHFRKPFPSGGDRAENTPEQRDKKNLSYLLLSTFTLFILAILMFLLEPSKIPENETATRKKGYSGAAPILSSTKSTTAVFKDSSMKHGIIFVADLKWEDDKMYINFDVRFLADPIWNFKDWTWLLLDSEGYLIKQYDMTLNHYMFKVAPGGRIAGLTGKRNDSLAFTEYERISHLQVVLDKKFEQE